MQFNAYSVYSICVVQISHWSQKSQILKNWSKYDVPKFRASSEGLTTFGVKWQDLVLFLDRINITYKKLSIFIFKKLMQQRMCECIWSEKSWKIKKKLPFLKARKMWTLVRQLCQILHDWALSGDYTCPCKGINTMFMFLLFENLLKYF